MKKHLLLLLTALLAVVSSAFAYDFSAVAPSGQTLYYNIVNGNAEVSYYSPSSAGALTIPDIVTNNGTTYAVTSICRSAFYNCYGLTSVIIPNSITLIGDHAFEGCTSLTSVNIPNSVTTIAFSTFFECSGLTSVTIPSSVTSIGAYAFSLCSSLTSVIIPSSVTSIYNEAFYGCCGLTSVTIPSSVTSIGDEAFFGVRHIEYYGSATGSPWGAMHMNGVKEGDFIYSDSTKSHLWCYYGNGGAVTIPSSVISIGDSAFYMCSGLTSVTIPNSITSIDKLAFYNCSGLISVTIGNGVTSMGRHAFSECTSLTSVIFNADSCISEGDYIGGGVFNGCSSLTNISFGNNVRHIPSWLCGFCSGLTTITIPNSVTSIGSSAFYYCSGLTSLIIPSSVTYIGEYAFSGCSGLTSVTIPRSVTSIANSTFSGCSGLTSVTIPSSVTSIGSDAFYNCNHLVTVRCRAVYPPTVGSNSFYNIPEYSTLIVPCGSQQYYSVTTAWNSVFNIMQEDCRDEFTVTVVSANPTMGSATVDGLNTATVLDGDEAMLVAMANDGYRFVRWNDNDTNAVRTVTVTANVTYTAYFENDPFGIADIDVTQIKIYATEGRIIVHGTEGMDVRVYDMMGRQVAYSNADDEHDIPVPLAGVYLVKVGTLPARKVVVIR